MDLQHLLGVVQAQRFVVRLRKRAPIAREANRHRRPEHNEALVQPDHLHLVQPQQRAIEQLRQVTHLRLQREVALQCFEQFSERRLDQQIRAALPGRCARQPVFQQALRAGAAHLRRAIERAPRAIQRQPHSLRVDLSQADAADAASVITAVVGKPTNDAQHRLRQCGAVACFLQPLSGLAQVQNRRLPLRKVWRKLTQFRDQRAFHRGGLLEPATRRSLDANVHERGHCSVVACDAERREVVERFAQPLSRQASDAHQLIGREALVCGRIDQRCNQLQQLGAIRIDERLVRRKLARRFLDRVHA